jgi:hypothetical protein
MKSYRISIWVSEAKKTAKGTKGLGDLRLAVNLALIAAMA